MSFFGVSIDALRVAGGTVVAVSGWRMLYNPQETEDRKQDHASNAERAKAWGSDVAFFPLTMPFTTGPGTISVAIALSANRPGDHGGIAAVLRRHMRRGDHYRIYSRSLLCVRGSHRRPARAGTRAHLDAIIGVPAALHRRANSDDRYTGSTFNDHRRGTLIDI